MWAAVNFVNQLEILEILAKSLQQSWNRLLLAEAEELLYGEALPLCEFLPQLEQRLFCSCIVMIFSKGFSLLIESSVKNLPYSHAVYSPFESVLLMCYFLE